MTLQLIHNLCQVYRCDLEFPPSPSNIIILGLLKCFGNHCIAVGFCYVFALIWHYLIYINLELPFFIVTHMMLSYVCVLGLWLKQPDNY